MESLNVKISLLQTNPQDDKAKNLANVTAMAASVIKDERPDLIVLPEYFNFYGGSTEAKLAAAETLDNSETWAFLSNLARTNNVWVHGGTVMEVIPGEERFYNTSLVFNRKGEEVARYRKIHLFDIIGPDGTAHRESDLIKPGEAIVTFDLEGHTVGCVICYDIRFSDLFLKLAEKPCDLILVPAAFTLHTGMDHWEVILRGRAIETQAYVAACGQWGKNVSNGRMREVYGNSMIIDPWGHVVARASNGVTTVSGTAAKAQVEKVRSLIPLQQNRRLR